MSPLRRRGRPEPDRIKRGKARLGQIGSPPFGEIMHRSQGRSGVGWRPTLCWRRLQSSRIGMRMRNERASTSRIAPLHALQVYLASENSTGRAVLGGLHHRYGRI
jgi:hypothetical protein